MSEANTDPHSNRAPDNVTQPLPETQDVAMTDASIGSIGRPGMRNGKGAPKHSQKVKFSVEDGDETSNIQYSTQIRDPLGNPIPEIRVPASEDVADHTLTPPGWEGRTNAAAAHALTRASRLANKLSTPGTTTKVHSGSSTPIYNPHRGKSICPRSPLGSPAQVPYSLLTLQCRLCIS